VNGAGTPLLLLVTGSAGSTIDGFSFSGSAQSILSTSGPLNGLTIANNIFTGFTGQAIFLNDNGINVTITQNGVDGSSKVGSGALVHLDTDDFDGLYLTSNCISNNAVGLGFNVDGNNNADAGTLGSRTPLIDGNLLENNVSGMGLGTRAFGSGTISNNTFQNNAADGLQGGIRNSTITGNQVLGNGRRGLSLTAFTAAVSGDATRGAFGNTISLNTFTDNDSAGYFVSQFMFPGHAATNVCNNNDFVLNGNGVGGLRYGADYRGSEVFNVGCNWWGHVAGPDFAGFNANPGADKIQGPPVTVYSPWLTASISAGPPMCNGVPVEISGFTIE
jgi:hypothetical protein